MSTGRFLLLLGVILAALTSVALLWRPDPEEDGKTPLVWTSDNNPARTDQIAAFNKLHPALDLSLDFGNSGSDKVILQSSSGVGPDIFDYSGSEQLQTYVEAGIAWDVTEAARKMGFSAALASWKGAEGELTYLGRQYGYPCNTTVSIIIYNKNIFRLLWRALSRGHPDLGEIYSTRPAGGFPGGGQVAGLPHLRRGGSGLADIFL